MLTKHRLAAGLKENRQSLRPAGLVLRCFAEPIYQLNVPEYCSLRMPPPLPLKAILVI